MPVTNRIRRAGWDPHSLDWRIAALFIVGSFLFALGSFPLYAQNVRPAVVGITFVVGSLFFTAAGASAFVEVAHSDDCSTVDIGSRAVSRRRMLWWAAAVQLVGTVLFNVNTVDALARNFDRMQTNRLVWAPDMVGSMAFLVASHLAWVVACGGWWRVRRDDDEWRIAALNYVGSVFFMAAAIGAFTLETTGQALNLTLVNSGTFLGAVCFLVGAYLLLPDRRDPPPQSVRRPTAERKRPIGSRAAVGGHGADA